MLMIKKFNVNIFFIFIAKETKAQLEKDFKVTAEFVQADFVADNKASVDRLFSTFDEIGGDFQVRALQYNYIFIFYFMIIYSTGICS